MSEKVKQETLDSRWPLPRLSRFQDGRSSSGTENDKKRDELSGAFPVVLSMALEVLQISMASAVASSRLAVGGCGSPPAGTELLAGKAAL